MAVVHSFFREMDCVIYIYDHFRYPCHFGNHIPSLRVDLVCAVFMCVAGSFGNGMAGDAWFFLRAHRICTNTRREFALKVDCGRKMPCRTSRTHVISVPDSTLLPFPYGSCNVTFSYSNNFYKILLVAPLRDQT